MPASPHEGSLQGQDSHRQVDHFLFILSAFYWASVFRLEYVSRSVWGCWLRSLSLMRFWSGSEWVSPLE